MAMHRLFEAVHEMKAPLMMVVVQVALAGINILYKLAAHDGMNLTLVVAYRFILTTAFLAPLAFSLERKSWPKITWTVLGQAFFCGLFGESMGQNFYLASLSMTSATYASAMANLVPAITFVLAVFSWVGVGEGEAEDSCREGKSGGNIHGHWWGNAAPCYISMEVNLGSTHVNLLRHVAKTQQGLTLSLARARAHTRITTRYCPSPSAPAS